MRNIIMRLSQFLFLALCGCGGNSLEEFNQITDNDTLIVEVNNSIGIEHGDSCYVFGEIIAVRDNSHGSILILDRIRSQVVEYDSTGTFSFVVARAGSGPEELLRPIDFDLNERNEVMILDMMKGQLLSFSEDGEFLEVAEVYSNMPPLRLNMSSDQYLLSLHIEQNNDENGTLSLYASLYLQHLGTEDQQNLWSSSFTVDPYAPEAMYYSSILALVYDLDSQGNIYLAPTDSGKFHLLSYDANGALRWEIEQSVDPVEKTPHELANEQELVRSLAQRFGGSISHEFSPPAYRKVIRDIDVDCYDRIWVRNGLQSAPVFDVYTASGEHLGTVLVEITDDQSSIDWEFEIDHSITCFSLNPEDYPRILQCGTTDLEM